MKFLFTLLFLPLFSFAQTNSQRILGYWVKVKAERKDGSPLIDNHGCGMDFQEYEFASDGLANQSTEVLFGYGHDIRFQYFVEGSALDTLIIGIEPYKILKLTKDTLKISLVIRGADDTRTTVFYFVKVLEKDIPAKAFFDNYLKDSVYQATNELFPHCKQNLWSFASGISTAFDRGSFKASFIIDKKGQMREFTVIEKDSVSNSFIKIVANAFGELSWQPALKNNHPVNSIVQVSLKSGHRRISSSYIQNKLDIEYPFLP